MNERLCPVCQVALVPQMHLGITIDVCPTCAGIWFDADELTRLHNLDPQILPRLDHQYQPVVERYSPPWERLCPVCRVLLYRYNYLYTSTIELDACDKCGGTWVDNGELEKMERVLQEAKAMEIPPEVEAQVELARIEAEHKETMARKEFWRGLFQFMRARPRFPL